MIVRAAIAALVGGALGATFAAALPQIASLFHISNEIASGVLIGAIAATILIVRGDPKWWGI